MELGFRLLSSPSSLCSNHRVLSPLQGPGKVTVKAGVSTRVGFMAVYLAVTRQMFTVTKQTNKTLHTQLPLHPRQCQPNVFYSWAPLPVCSPTLHPRLIQMACGCWGPTTMGNGLFHNLLQTRSLTANRLETFSNKNVPNQTETTFLLFEPLSRLLLTFAGETKKRRPPTHSRKCHQSPACCLESRRVIVLLATELLQLSLCGARTASRQPGASGVARRT